MAGFDPVSPCAAGLSVLITGANSGIGRGAAQLLARSGAEVLLGCRDVHKAEQARARILAETKTARVSIVAIDLSSLASVREAARRLCSERDRLDVLVNNAGVMAVPRALTADGFELQLGVNHLSHFALTGLLLGPLLRAPAARVVTVSSLVHYGGRIRFDDLDGERRYQPWSAYSQSKLANLLFAFELERRLQKRAASRPKDDVGAPGATAISVGCHPGYAATNLQFVAPEFEGSRLKARMFAMANALFAQSPERGAWPTVHAATSPEVTGGAYIGPSGPFELWGKPGRARPSARAQDPELARRLWSVSVERTGVDYAELERYRP